MINKTKYNIPVLFCILIYSSLMHTACDTVDTSFERDNPSDPGSPSFVHTKPDMFTVDVVGEKIDIRWRSNTTYNDGYLIEKAINDTTQFEYFASLPKHATGFADNSGKIGLYTYYRISTVEKIDGIEKKVHSEVLSIKVNVITSHNITSVNLSNNINVMWSNSNSFLDGIRIEEKSPRDSVYRTIIDIGDEYNVDLNNTASFTSELEYFQSDIRIVAYQYQNDQIVDIQYVEKRIPINGISSLNVTYVSELEMKIVWEGYYDFADHYLLELERNGTVVGTWEMPATGTFSLEKPITTGFSAFRVTGIHTEFNSNTHVRSVNFFSTPPTLSVNSTNVDNAIIMWRYTVNGPKASMFTLERSTNNSAFEDIAVLPKDQYSYIDYDLIPGNTYQYRVRTMISSPSNPLEIKSGERYIITDEAEVSIPRSSSSTFTVKFADEKTAFLFGDIQQFFPLTQLNVENLSVQSNFSTQNETFGFDISPDGKQAVELVRYSSTGRYNLNIWNITTSTQERVIPDFYVNSVSTNPLARTKYLPSGEHVALIELYNDPKVTFWNLITGEIENVLNVDGGVIKTFRVNTEKNEIIIITNNEIQLYDFLSLEFKRRIPIHLPFLTISSPSIISSNGENIILFADNQLYKIDLNTGAVFNNIGFDRNIRFISTNKNRSDIIVTTLNEVHVIDTDSFNVIQTLKLNTNQPYFAMLNPYLDDSATTLTRIIFNGPWKFEKWQKRDIWYNVKQ